MPLRFLYTTLATAAAVLILMLVWLLQLSHDTAFSRAQDQADNLVQTIEGELSATLRRMDATLHQIAERMPVAGLQAGAVPRQEAQIRNLLQSYKRSFPELRDIFVYAGDGDILYDTMRPHRPIPMGSIVGRPAYQELLRNPTATIAFSDLVRGAVSGQLTVATYVPVRDASGRLLGLITASLDLAYFDRLFQGLKLGPQSVLFVRRTADHKLVIRYPWIESEFNKPVRNRIQERIDAGEERGQDNFQARTDGVRRVYAFQRLDPYPFYVAVGLAETGVLAEWRKTALIVVLGLALMVTVLGLLLWRGNRAERQRHLALAQAETAHALLQEAIDSISAGLVIYDASDGFVMCNRAYRQIFAVIDDLMRPGVRFEELTRTGLSRGLFPRAMDCPEDWLTQRLRLHEVADGQPHEIELAQGRWIQISEHRTPMGYRVGSRIDITERKRLEVELREQASTDALTGMSNRRHFLQRLEDELGRVRRQATREAAVLMLDLDHFKQVNDVYGHAAGDSLLRHFANLLRQELRSTDTAGRIGGEEFAVILPGTGREAAQILAQRICDTLTGHPLMFAGQEIRATVSIGISAISIHDLSADAVLNRADRALYQAKEGGRNRVATAYG